MKRSECLFICTLLLAMVACCGAFAGEGTEPEKKTPDTYFVSPHVDPTMEFDVQEVEIKGVKLKIPVLKGCTLESKIDGEGDYEKHLVIIMKNNSPAMLLIFNIDNIKKDDRSFYTGFRSMVYEWFLDGTMTKNSAHFLEIRGIHCKSSNEPTFESNYPNAFLFRNEFICEFDGITATRNMSTMSAYIKGYFFTILCLDFSETNGSKKLVSTWIDYFQAANQ